MHLVRPLSHELLRSMMALVIVTLIHASLQAAPRAPLVASPSASPSISPSPSPEVYSLIVRQEPEQRAYVASPSLAQESPQPSPSFHQMTFATPEERDLHLQHMERSGVDAEESVIFRTDDLRLTDAQFIEMAEKDAKGDPLLSSQWSLFPRLKNADVFEGVDIDILRAWTIVRSAPKVVVYVVDSGIDESLVDLKGRVVATYNALDPSKPGFDDNGHGTHVTSIIGAKGANGADITGIVPEDLIIIAVKFIGASSEGDTNAALKAFQWIESDIRARREKDPSLHFIVSNSWGGGYSRFLEEAFQSLSSMGALIVTSAGNSASNNDEKGYFPCNFRANANLCVAATDSSDRLASFSGRGVNSVHLAAPGVQILGLVPAKNNLKSCSGSYCKLNGTSQAVPHVSGVAALVWAANPSLSHLDVHEILLNSVDRLPNLEGMVMSGGRLNAYRAVLMATGQDPSAANRSAVTKPAGGGGGCSLGSRRASTSQPDVLPMVTLVLLGMLLGVHRRHSKRS